MELEIELTFLAKYLPEDLKDHPAKEILDIYIPSTAHNAGLRIRKNGDKYMITKKLPVNLEDASQQNENTIPLTLEEYNELSNVKGKRVRKVRYQYPYQGKMAEFDVFLDDLEGLVLIDFEFKSKEEMDQFKTPDFCLAEITQEEFIAGGYISGKSYTDIEENLKKYSYHPL